MPLSFSSLVENSAVTFVGCLATGNIFDLMHMNKINVNQLLPLMFKEILINYKINTHLLNGGSFPPVNISSVNMEAKWCEFVIIN